MIPEKITYRKAVEKDLDFLLNLREETMTNHLFNSGFKVTEENHLERIKYQFENAKIILLDEIEIGLLKIIELKGQIEIIQIQISSNFQGKGFGTKIIKSIIEQAVINNLRLKLSVLKQNKAKGLYLNLGFKIIKVNKNSFEMEYR